MRSFAFWLAVLVIVPRPAAAQQPQWTIGGSAAREYAVEGAGAVTDGKGARLTLRSTVPTPASFGAASVLLPADAYKRARVRLRGEVRTHNVAGGGASIWLRIDGASGMLLLDNATEQAIRGDSGWVTQEIILPVPRDASRLVLGALLRGTGEMEVRALRLDTVAVTGVDEPSGMAKTMIDSAFALVRAQSMWRDTVSWSAIEPDVRELARGATKGSDVYPAVRLLLVRLGDHHSFFLPPRQTSQFRSGGAENPRAVVRSLDGGVGYVSVPGYSGIEQQAARDYARTMHDSLAAAMPNASCGWIVDLRGNTGGNMYPMLAGLKPFLGSDALGAFIGPSGQSNNWAAGMGVQQTPPPTLAPLESTYVAVLTGPRTASSGEAVTISFIGRARTRSFGAPTAGLSTANGTFPLPDGSMIVLTTAIEADRTGRRYGAKVDPDEAVGGANREVAAGDSTVDAASRWLHQSGRCVAR